MNPKAKIRQLSFGLDREELIEMKAGLLAMVDELDAIIAGQSQDGDTCPSSFRCRRHRRDRWNRN